MIDTRNAPGCYGSALTFNSASQECSPCPFAQTCSKLSEISLASIRIRLGIKPPEQRKVKKLIEVPPKNPLFTTKQRQAKILNTVERIEANKIKVTRALSNGINPFKSKPEFLKVICHILLKFPNGVSPGLLQQALQAKLDWSDATAKSYVSQAKQILTAFGAIDEIDGAIKIRRK